MRGRLHASTQGLTRRSWNWPTLSAIAVAGAAALLMPTVHVVNELLSDSYMVLYTGRWIAHSGIPQHEVFALAAHGHRWIDQQWLAELGFYEAWWLGGYALVAGVTAGLVSLTAALLAALIRRRGGSAVISISFSLLAIAIALPYVFVRAQDFALPLFALLLALCLTDSDQERPQRRLAMILPLLVLWANLHGSVLLGAGLGTAYLLYRATMMARRRQWRTAAGCGLLGFLAALSPLATPYGAAILSYYREIIGNTAIADLVPEWRSPTFPSLEFFQLAVPPALIAILLVASLARRRGPSPLLITAVLITGAAAATTTRDIVWFAMTTCVLLAEMTQSLMPTAETSRRFLILTSGVAAAFAVVAAGLLIDRGNKQYEALTPLRAIAATAAYASSHPCVRILGDNAASSALLWHDPSLAGRIAFDARLEQYPDPELLNWAEFQLAEGNRWLQSTRGYGILVGSAAYNPTLVKRLARLPDTRVLARDARGTAVVRLGAPDRPGCISRAKMAA